MGIEIERKFLVEGDYKIHATESNRITQGYLSSNPERSVRIRIKGDKAFITVKGITGTNRISRYEWEKEIELSEAKDLLTICEPGIIDKTRYVISYGGHLFEVDEFHGENDGLTVAEIELATESQSFEKPSWLGREVTGDDKYYNASLSKHPYSKW